MIKTINLTNQLTETEFKKTFGNEMTDVTQTAQAVIDIWDYVEELVKQKLVDSYVFENGLVEKVYRNDLSTFEHILLPTNEQNAFITLVVDLKNETIFGHYNLDLNQKYGVTK